MGTQPIAELVEGTADPAFAIDRSGLITAWNTAAEELFGLGSAGVIGRPSHEILQGVDEDGAIGVEHCAIQRALKMNRPVGNFDLQVQTRTGRQWCNISVMFVTDQRLSPHAVHIVRPREIRKRFEQLLRDFLVTHTQMSSEAASRLLSSARVATTNVKLTTREAQIIRMLAKGKSTSEIASDCSISRSTANNHIMNIMSKLDAHNRLEAVHRAENCGLL
jgi:PAS domain S-box-containing protein